jgi:hypothetical protein
MKKDVIIHERAVGKEMAGAVSRVVSGSPESPALFAHDKDAARRFIEFFTANICNPNTRPARAAREKSRSRWQTTSQPVRPALTIAAMTRFLSMRWREL